MTGKTALLTSRWRRRGVLRAGAGASIAAALVAAGCGDDDKPAAATNAPAAGATTAPSPATTAAASATPQSFLASIQRNPPDPIDIKDWKMGGSITRITDRPLGFDSVGIGGTSNVGMTVDPVYSKLVRYSNRANMKNVMAPDLEGDLALSWEQPDESTVIFQLAPNIKWQDVAPLNGRPFTVDDLKYNFNRGSTHQKSAFKAYYNIVKSVDDAGGGKARLNLSRPYQPIVELMTYIAFMVIPRELGDGPPLTTAVGTGGFIMTKATPNVGVEYRKNPTYFKKDSTGRQMPYLDGYTLSIVADAATRLALVESGKADSAYQQSSPLSIDNVEEVAKRHPGLLGFQVNGQQVNRNSLAGHWPKPPWNDVRVRRALNMLLDRESIMKNLFKGLSFVGPFVPQGAAFDQEQQLSDLGPYYKYDPKEAKALLSAAGVTNPEWSLDWYEAESTEALVTLFQQSAAEAGVKINLVKNADLTAHSAKQQSKSWKDLILRAKAADFVDGQATQLYTTPGASQNATEIDDPELNALYEKLAPTKGAARKAATKAIWDRHLDQIYEIMLPQAYDLFWWNLRMHNWRNTGTGGNIGLRESNMDHVWVS